MLNPSTFSNTTSPFFDEDNVLSNLASDINSIYSMCEYHFPSSPITYHYETDLSYLLSNHELVISQQVNKSHVEDDLEVISNNVDSNKGDEVNGIVEEDSGVNKMAHSIICQGLKRRRTSNKDRHSKIQTAQGLRDRRMRLSLEVAGPFFNLQELLGYDKPSQTVGWLFRQSKAAIEEVQQSKNGSMSSVITKCTISSTSDCEGDSIFAEQRRAAKSEEKKKKAVTCGANDSKPKQKRMKPTKEAREKARDKARQRTMEKLQRRGAREDHVDDILEVPHFRSTTQWNITRGPQQW